MDKLVFIAANGAKQALQAQTSISHNLANASTVGFKANLDTFTNWHLSGGPGMNTRIYNQLEMRGSNLLSGDFTTTNRELMQPLMVKAGLQYKVRKEPKLIPVQVTFV